MKKRLISILLGLALLLSLLPAGVMAAAPEFPDMPEESFWSFPALRAAIDNGLLNGSGGKLLPTSKLTRAQMAAIINRAFGAIDTASITEFTDVDPEAWFAQDIARAVRMGTFQGSDGKMRPNDPISRQEAFAVLARAFKLGSADPAAFDRFSDKGDISAWAVPELAAMAAAGYVNGSGGKLNPKNTITRAEFAQVMYNMIKIYVNQPGAYQTDVVGNLMVNVSDVTLRSMKVEGDLILGEGVANGNVFIDGVEITGRLVIRGGGEHSIYITNRSDVGSILVAKTGDGGLRIRTEEGYRVELVNIEDGRDDIILEGEFNQVAVATDAPVILRDADITGLTLKAENTDVSLEGETYVSAVSITGSGAGLRVGEKAEVASVRSEAENVRIDGTGDVTAVTANGSNTAVDTPNTTVTAGKNATGVTAGGKPVAPGTTGSTKTHTHTWIETVTGEPTCTEAGSKTLKCECGESRTESIPALGHEWDEGVQSEADEITFTCTRCGETRTQKVDAKPFCIDLSDEEGQGEGDVLWFDTLDEALAEAAKYPTYGPEEEGSWTEYKTIVVAGSTVLHDLELPAGYSLWVRNKLSLTGEVKLGASDEEVCPGCGAARIMTPDWGEGELWYQGVHIFGGEGAAICAELPEDEDFSETEVITVFGARNADGEEYSRPWLAFEAWYDDARFEIVNDISFENYYDGVLLSDAPQVAVRSDIVLGETRIRDGSNFVLEGGEGSISFFGQKMFGFTDDCAVQMEDCGAIYGSDRAVTLTGGNVTINRDVNLEGVTLDSDPDDSLTIASGVCAELPGAQVYGTVKIEKGAELTLSEGANIFDRLENDGILNTLFTGVFFYKDSVLVNRGTINIPVYDDLPGALGIEGALFVNEGTVNNDATIRFDGGTFENKGTVNNCGELSFTGGSFESSGTLNNSGRVNLSPGTDDYTDCGDRAEQTHAITPCGFSSGGTVVNEGEFLAGGTTLENSGKFYNYGDVRFTEILRLRQDVIVERIEGIPQSDEEWGRFWLWDDNNGTDDTPAYLAIAEQKQTILGTIPCEFINKGLLENSGDVGLESVRFVNDTGATLNNECRLSLNEAQFQYEIWWTEDWEAALGETTCSAPEFCNRGTFNNGAITSVGDGEGGSRADFYQDAGKFTSSGSVTNNGYLNLQHTALENTGNFETYNSGGFEIVGGSQKLTAPIYNEGYMKVVDLYGDDKEFCDIDNIKSLTRDDSNWIDFTARVFDETGFRAAETEQEKTGKYNRMDIADDITFTKDVTLHSFRDHWLWQKDTPEGTVGVTVTVPRGVTLTVARESNLCVDGIDWTEQLLPNTLKIDGTLVIEPTIEGNEENDWQYREQGRVEIWTYGSFVCSGTVKNEGYFEIRSMETYDEGEDGERSYNGRDFFRPEECRLVGAPANAVQAAEIRSFGGLQTALAQGYGRLLLRENYTIAVTKDVTVQDSVHELYVEDGCGIIVEHGAALTLECDQLSNDGDVSIYGDMTIGKNTALWNNQNLELGAITGSEKANLIVGGHLANYNRFSVYPTGSIIFGTGSWFENNAELCEVSNIGGLSSGNNLIFTGDVTFGPDCEWYQFDNCVFRGDVTVDAGNNFDFWAGFNGCTFENGTIIVRSAAAKNGPSTNVSIDEYGPNPHIFGGNAIFVGVWSALGEAEYEVRRGGTILTGYSVVVDADNEDKTHLEPTGSGTWFTPEESEDVSLTVRIKDGPTFIYETVPVKVE